MQKMTFISSCTLPCAILSFKYIFLSSHTAFLVNLNTISIPTTLSKALSNEKWKQAMNEKTEALEKNKTWALVKLL